VSGDPVFALVQCEVEAGLRSRTRPHEMRHAGGTVAVQRAGKRGEPMWQVRRAPAHFTSQRHGEQRTCIPLDHGVGERRLDLQPGEDPLQALLLSAGDLGHRFRRGLVDLVDDRPVTDVLRCLQAYPCDQQNTAFAERLDLAQQGPRGPFGGNAPYRQGGERQHAYFTYAFRPHVPPLQPLPTVAGVMAPPERNKVGQEASQIDQQEGIRVVRPGRAYPQRGRQARQGRREIGKRSAHHEPEHGRPQWA